MLPFTYPAFFGPSRWPLVAGLIHNRLSRPSGVPLMPAQWAWKGLCLVSLLSLSLTGNAQTPAITWQKALGGTGADRANAITATSDGGVVVAGYSYSNDGDVTDNHGDTDADYWVAKLDAAGNKVWQKALGGSRDDRANAITASSDGGFVVAGYSYSTDGDVTGNHGGGDYWIVKLDVLGNKVWQKSLGGSAFERAYAITASTDGGFVVAGYSQSTDGDVTGNHGNTDYWVVKLDAAGNLVWQKALGGSNSDQATAITASGDGGFVVAGFSGSTDGDVIGNQGSADYWVVKLDAAGNKVWLKDLGGSNSDQANALTASSDGGFVVAGESTSTDGDVTGNHGNYDYWVVKLDAAGTKIWQKSLGGTDFDVANAIMASSDGGFVVAGYSGSTDGDVTGNHGNTDYWVVKLDAAGNKVWQKSLGGSSGDAATAITASSGGGFVVAGYSTSTDGDVTDNHGKGDYWVVKLGPNALTLTNLAASPSPVCAGQPISFTATVGNLTGSYNYTLTNGAGSSLQGSSSATPFSQSLTASSSGPQSYTLTIATTGGSISASVGVNVNTIAPQNVALSNSGPISDNNQTVTLTASGGSTYTFSATAIQQGGGNTATVNAPGPYSVTVTANGCSGVASTTVTGAQNPATVCRNGTAIIKVIASGNPVKYEWYKNTLSSPRLAEITLQQRGTATASLTLINQQTTANFYVRVTDANGSAIVYGPFKVTVNMGCATTLGRLAAEEVELRITLLGNPLIGEQLRATVVGAAGKALHVQLLDLSGKPIRQQAWQQAESEQTIDWNVAGQASGVYLLQATTEADSNNPAQRQSLKVIKP